MTYPDNCIRGVQNDNYLEKDGWAASHLFHFDLLADNRGDGWAELSINWEDDDQAIAATLRQTRNDGEPQFSAGAAILKRAEIDHISERPYFKGLLRYERQKEVGNDYHGNLLLRPETDKAVMKRIAATIATLAVERIVPPL